MSNLPELDQLQKYLQEVGPADASAYMAELMPQVFLKEVVIQLKERFPDNTLYLGLADDGFPVILNLHDPVPGPLLVAADKGAGKTAYLKMIAAGLQELQDPSDAQYAVITANPKEWEGYEESANCAGIFPAYDKSAADLLLSLGEWAHANKTQQSIVLLVDDLSSMADIDPEAKDTLRWLLLRGPAKHVWPIVTLAPNQSDSVAPWLPMFRTSIHGQTQGTYPRDKFQHPEFDNLVPGSQFVIREGTNYLKFWIPRLD